MTWITQPCARCGRVYEGSVPDGTPLEGLTCDACRGVTILPSHAVPRPKRMVACQDCETPLATSPDDDRELFRCRACADARHERQMTMYAEVRRVFGDIGGSNRGQIWWYLAYHYLDHGGVRALLRATDRRLLAVEGIGPRSVERLRQHWPQLDDWIEHAEMLAGRQRCRFDA